MLTCFWTSESVSIWTSLTPIWTFALASYSDSLLLFGRYCVNPSVTYRLDWHLDCCERMLSGETKRPWLSSPLKTSYQTSRTRSGLGLELGLGLDELSNLKSQFVVLTPTLSHTLILTCTLLLPLSCTPMLLTFLLPVTSPSPSPSSPCVGYGNGAVWLTCVNLSSPPLLVAPAWEPLQKPYWDLALEAA